MADWTRRLASTVVGGAIIFGAASLWVSSRATAESATDDTDGGTERDVSSRLELMQNERRLAIQRTGMLTLLGWSAANIGIGSYGWATTDGSTKYFYQMNTIWNGVNALIGGLGYVQATSEDPRALDSIETIEETRSTQQILAFNAGLDVAYVASGAWLRQRGERRDNDRLVGYGESVMLQGAFLFVFDAVLWAFHQGAIDDYKTRLRASPSGGPGMILSVDF